MQIPKRLDLSVLTSTLAFAIMKAHRSGKSIEAIERLLCCPAESDGLTRIQLTQRTRVNGTKERILTLHTQATEYEISIHPTTDAPNCVPEVLSVDRQGASRPCFRTAPIAITTGKNTIVKVPVSLLSRDYQPLTVAQQTLLLKTLVPDLPPISPLLTDTPPIEISVQTMVRSDRTGQPYVKIRFCVTPAGPVTLNPDFHEFDTLLADETYRFNVGETKPHRCTVGDINLSGTQLLIASMHAIQDIFAHTPEWQLLYTSDYPQDHRASYIAPCDPSDLKQLLCRYATLRLNLGYPPFEAVNRIGYTSEHAASYPHFPPLLSEHFPPQQQTIPTFSFAQHKQHLYSQMCNLYTQQAQLLLSC